MVKYLSLTKAQQQLLSLPDQLIDQPAIITTEDQPVMMALSISQFESLFAMVEVLSQSKTDLNLFQSQLTLFYQIMGVILHQQGQLKKAESYYHQALEYQPNCAEVHGNLGSLYATQHQWEQAIASYQTALQFKPSLAGIYRNLARIWQIKNQPQKVNDCQYQACLLEPEQLPLEDYLKLGQTLLKHNQLERTIQLYSQAVKVYPKTAKIYYFFGKALSQAQQWEAACLNYEKAIQLNPDAHHYYNSLGDALTQLQEWEKAIETYLKGIQVDPNVCWSYLKLADAYLECQQWENAIKAYRQGLKLNPDNYWPYIKMGDAFIELDQTEEAIAIYKKAQKINPNLENSYYKLAELFKKIHQDNEAIIQYKKTLEINPSLLFIYEDLGDLLQDQKRWQEAVELYKKAIQFNPGTYRLYFKLGLVLQYQQKWHTAIEAFIRTIELKTDCFDAYNELAYIFECQGYPETAIACLHYKLLPPIVIETFCEYPQEQVVSLESAADVTTIHLYPEHQKKCVPPITLDGTVEDCFKHEFFTSSAAFVSILPNGKALADPILTSAVLNSKSQLIPELSSGHPEFLISSNHPYSLHEINENIAFLSVRWGNGGYFHWMFDVIARLHLVQRVSQSQNIKIDKFVFSHCSNQSQIDCLAVLGIAAEEILESFEYPYLKAKQVIVPNIVQEFGISKWKCHYLKQAFLNQNTPPQVPGYRRIYIDRNQANYRKVLNNEQVVELLERYGFQRLHLETLSIVEQAYYLNAAEVVVAPHGAGLTNLVFCDSETKVIEIFSPGYITPLYWFLSTICQLEHYYLLGERLPEDDDPKINPVTRDIRVNLPQLEQLLKKAGL